MAYDDRALRGIGGWLAFFILTLAVFAPLRAIYGVVQHLYANPAIATFYGPHWRYLEWMTWTTTGISLVWYKVLAWRLISVRARSTVRLVIGSLWAVALIPSIIQTLGVSILSGVNALALLKATGWARARPLAYAAFWSAYLLRSKRVANTYPEYGDTAHLAAVFD